MSKTTHTDHSGIDSRKIEEQQPTNVARRRFLGGSAAAVAGASALTGCIRKPVEHILPYTQRPEDLVPGQPVFYATSMSIGSSVQGLLVESQDGRPTKVEGNPSHPMTNPLITSGSKHAGTNTWAQAAVYQLYDPDRAQAPNRLGTETTWEEAHQFIAQLSQQLDGSKGEGAALLTEKLPSPTYQSLLGELVSRFPKIKLYEHDPAVSQNGQSAAAQVGAGNTSILYNLDQAAVIVAIDADLFGTETDAVRNTRLFSHSRRVDGVENPAISRLYSVETGFSVTGGMADNRLRLRSNLIGAFLVKVASELGISDLGVITADFGAQQATVDKWVTALAADLKANAGKSALSVGSRQPAAVHALAYRINVELGNIGVGKPVQLLADTNGQKFNDVSDLKTDLLAGRVKQLILVGGNPVMTLSGRDDFAALIANVPASVHLGLYRDETGSNATWQLPRAHFLEAWGDLRGTDGTESIQQPLIRPLYAGAMSPIEFVAHLLGRAEETGHQLVENYRRTRMSSGDKEKQTLSNAQATVKAANTAVKAATTALNEAKSAPAPAADAGVATADNSVATAEQALKTATAAAEKAATDVQNAQNAIEQSKKQAVFLFGRSWRRWLHDGVVSGTSAQTATPTWNWGGLKEALASDLNTNTEGLEVNVVLDATILDGRFCNIPWLQELPDPMTKLVWENAALMSPATAAQHNVGTNDIVRIAHDGSSITLPVLEAPGVADGAVLLALGYGRTHSGRVGNGCGVNVNSLLGADGRYFGSGATLEKTPRTAELAIAQGRFRQEPRTGWGSRDFVRENTVDGYKETPDFATQKEQHHLHLMKQESFKSLWEEPNKRDGQQWGMSIDLNACNGCGACMVACQAENNIPIVGKEEVRNGRELFWIRVDRYYTGPEDNPEAVSQPIACAQCETAPCENVCPVAATAHSPEGLNDMAYNRCIGTRYCANNCPYKVRRFNFYNYTKRNDELLGDAPKMQRNPDVTVRFRGVMEKCSYCVQRINGARIVAKRDGTGFIADDVRAQTACEQGCPANAIVFGDINDADSSVTQTKKSNRNYGLLEELNIHPRTTYLAKIRNPNPALVS